MFTEEDGTTINYDDNFIIQENTDQKKLGIWTLSTQGNLRIFN